MSVRVAELERVIVLLKRRLTRCVHERKSILSAERMREKLRKDPEYLRKFRSARRASTPGTPEHTAWREKIRSLKKKLPDMSVEQRRIYNKFRYANGFERADAIREAMR